jgi:hypothetical protein
MKLETPPQDVVIADNFEQRDVVIGDVAFILDLLSDKIYSDKELAVIRELSCNAHDSHVVAGTQDVPFDIHLPTQLEPWFCVRDYGTGLADNEIADIYSAIGVSTKRDTNELIGAFGVGSLSPYALCDAFTVRSFKNGVVRTYQCMRDEKRVPKVLPLGSAPTDEPNGLEVKLTVNGKVNEFETAAEKVFLFWDGTIPKINNQHVIRKCQEMRDKYFFKGDNFGLTPSWGSMYALMGNIAYKIPDSLDEFDVDGYLKFDLGELEFDTARENLSMTDKTKAALKAKFASVKDSLSEIAIDQIEAEDTPFKKAALAETLGQHRLGHFVGRNNLDCYALPEPAESVTYWQSNYRGSEKYHTKNISANVNAEYYLHKDRMQTRIKSYLKDMPSGHTLYIFKDLAQALECNIPVEMLKDLDNLPKVHRVSSGTTSKCKTLRFNSNRVGWGYSDLGYWLETEIEIDGSEIVYVEINRNKPVGGSGGLTGNNYQISSTLKISKEHIGEINLIGLKTAFLKTAAFRKGDFIHLDDYLTREYAKKAPKTFFEFNSSDLDRFKSINEYVDHDDDEVREIVELAKTCENTEVADICKSLGVAVEMTKCDTLQEMMDEWNDRHKMLTILSKSEIMSNKAIVAEYISGTLKSSTSRPMCTV